MKLLLSFVLFVVVAVAVEFQGQFPKGDKCGSLRLMKSSRPMTMRGSDYIRS